MDVLKKPVLAKQHICGLDPGSYSQIASNVRAVTLLKNKNAAVKLFVLFGQNCNLLMLLTSIYTCTGQNYLPEPGG